MDRRNRARSSSLFLLELILAILFFSLASAVCVQFFVKAHLLSHNARNLNHAVNECSGIAEIVDAADGADDAADMIRDIYKNAGSYPDDAPDAPTIRIYYDDTLKPCTAEEGHYVLQTALTEEDGMLRAAISMKEFPTMTAAIPMEEALLDVTPIYQLTVEHYLQRRPSNE